MQHYTVQNVQIGVHRISLRSKALVNTPCLNFLVIFIPTKRLGRLTCPQGPSQRRLFRGLKLWTAPPQVHKFIFSGPCNEKRKPVRLWLKTKTPLAFVSTIIKNLTNAYIYIYIHNISRPKVHQTKTSLKGP